MKLYLQPILVEWHNVKNNPLEINWIMKSRCNIAECNQMAEGEELKKEGIDDVIRKGTLFQPVRKKTRNAMSILLGQRK